MRPLFSRAWRAGLAAAGVALFSGCSWLNPFAGSSPKMAALPPIKATVEARVDWSYSIGKAGNFVFYPAASNDAVFVAAQDGSLARLENGIEKWRVKTGKPLSAGVGSDGERVAVGTRKGEALVFSARDGAFLWQAEASSEILAPPLVEGDLVIVKSGDHRLAAFDETGKQKWASQRPSPSLSLRGASPMRAMENLVLTGFPGGKLAAISQENGAPLWEGMVALPKGATELERVADVSAPPAVLGATVCAAAFQGRVTCFDFAQGGNVLWTRDNLSSHVGLALDDRGVYVTDDESALHALDLASGGSRWKMEKLLRRKLTAPLALGAYLALGDVEGYVHIVDRDDGALAGRLKLDGSIAVAPQPLPGGKFLIQTRSGRVYGVSLRQFRGQKPE
ncbi:MAG: outer membrane protein assembly factor BamB [Zoogloeaceae bacterium]|jgi:outer membrane protein assembly factor BamB|nr:outer membrane protein assembly factor BamB [Zoogloeaceae bacterium]